MMPWLCFNVKLVRRDHRYLSCRYRGCIGDLWLQQQWLMMPLNWQKWQWQSVQRS